MAQVGSSHSEKLSREQLTALHTLYALHAARAGADPDDRKSRLGWCSHELGRNVTSFGSLAPGEAAELIGILKHELGQAPTRPRPFRDRESAMLRGTAGRKGGVTNIATLATPEDLAETDRLREQLGWTREGFEIWLHSRRSPNHGRAELRTVADCNRVRWALLGILRRQRRAG